MKPRYLTDEQGERVGVLLGLEEYELLTRAYELTDKGHDELELIGERELSLPPLGIKPQGSANPPRPKGGGNPVSQAVIEDRR